MPCTASEPMSPPGKNGGCTTKVSVVKARRSRPTVSTAPSPSCVQRVAAEGRKEDVFDELRHLAPAAAVRHLHHRIVLGAEARHAKPRGHSLQAVHGLPLRRSAAVVEVGGTGALPRRPSSRRAGARACSAPPNCGQAVGRSRPCSTSPLRQSAGSADPQIGEAEDALGVEARIRRGQASAAGGDLADAAPLAIADLEHLAARSAAPRCCRPARRRARTGSRPAPRRARAG